MYIILNYFAVFVNFIKHYACKSSIPMLELLLKDRKIVFLPLLMVYHLPKTEGRFINSIFIGQERNEDGRNPSLKNFYYFARGVKFDNQDYTAKCVFVENDKSQIFYDQSLSSIEKGNLIEMIKNKSIVSNNGLDVGQFNLVNTKDSPNIYHDKRLIRICQVPQMPYLGKNIITGKWQPTKEAIKAVKAGKLFVEKKVKNM